MRSPKPSEGHRNESQGDVRQASRPEQELHPNVGNDVGAAARHALGWHLRLHAMHDAEIFTATRAALCSLLATLNDGLVYRGLLSIAAGHYAVAAFGGALMGGVMNFSLNRSWTFRGSWKRIQSQAGQYVAGALLTYLGLQAILWIFIARLGIGEQTAWFFAKVLAFVLISYPFQRLVVFRVFQPRKRWWLT